MSSGSILGLQEDLNIPNKNKIKNTPKVKLPQNLNTKKQTPPSIPQQFFRGNSVFIHINDAGLDQLVRIAMEKLEVTILQDFSLMADIIISDKPINLIPPSLGRSRGSMLVRTANLPTKMPNLILINQIPWIFDIVPKDIQDELLQPQIASQIQNSSLFPGLTTAPVSAKHNTPTSTAIHSTSNPPAPGQQAPIQLSKHVKQIDIIPSRTMIVADTQSRYRPAVQYVKTFPELHYGDTPKGYTISPFVKLPEDFGPSMERVRYLLQPKPDATYQKGPSNNSYCEICGCSFKNAEEHHTSPEHKIHVHSHIWDDFDDLSLYITQKKFFNIPLTEEEEEKLKEKEKYEEYEYEYEYEEE